MVRISFSNLFKEFKSTSTWLQFPYRHRGAEADSFGGKGGALSNCSAACWTFLSLNLKETLSKYLSTSYSYLKNIKLCANILVKNVFTSDIEYSPLEYGEIGGGEYFPALPHEMSLPLPKSAEFLDIYDYVFFPYDDQRINIYTGRICGVGPPGRPKQLKVMKPETMLKSLPGKANERVSRTFMTSGGEAVVNDMKTARRRTRRSDDRKMSKSRVCVADGEVECFVKREVDDLGKRANSDAFDGKSRSWRLAEIVDVGSDVCVGSTESGVVCSNIPRDETWCRRGGDLVGGEKGAYTERGSNVTFGLEDNSRPGKLTAIKKADLVVSFRNSDCNFLLFYSSSFPLFPLPS